MCKFVRSSRFVRGCARNKIRVESVRATRDRFAVYL